MIQRQPGLSARSPQQWEVYLETQVRAGASSQALVDELNASGYSPAEAQAMVSRAVRAQHNKLGLILGVSVLMFLCGLATLIAPVPSQGRLWIWIGAFACGLIGIVYSLAKLAKTR